MNFQVLNDPNHHDNLPALVPFIVPTAIPPVADVPSPVKRDRHLQNYEDGEFDNKLN